MTSDSAPVSSASSSSTSASESPSLVIVNPPLESPSLVIVNPPLESPSLVIVNPPLESPGLEPVLAENMSFVGSEIGPAPLQPATNSIAIRANTSPNIVLFRLSNRTASLPWGLWW